MDFEKDDRRLCKFNKTKKHFVSGKYHPKTKHDMTGPRQRPAEDQSYRGSRRINKQLAEETVEIIENGFYELDDGTIIDIAPMLSEAIKGTITYSSEDRVKINFNPRPTKFQVMLESTLSGAARMAEKSDGVCVLNFASAKNPGGGFLKGSSAQEESLVRASGLYKCIRDSYMYEFNSQDNNQCLYSHYMIYSPTVPVFRDDDGELLSEPYTVSFITAPAVNTGVASKRGVNASFIQETMVERIERVLSLAVYYQNDVLVLGSWGCGVFGGDINDLGRMFHKLLIGKFNGAFRKVLFSTMSEDDHDVLSRIF